MLFVNSSYNILLKATAINLNLWKFDIKSDTKMKILRLSVVLDLSLKN